MKYDNKIEINSTILYGDHAEEFISALPHYLNAHKAWVAATSGMTVEDLQEMSEVYSEYELLQKQAENLRNQASETEDEEQKKNLLIEAEIKEKESVQVALKITQTNGVQAIQSGYTQEQAKRVDETRQAFIQYRKKMIGYIAGGLRKEDLVTPAVTLDELLSLRGVVQEVLIADVANDAENGLPLGFLQALNQITPVLPSRFASLTSDSEQSVTQ